MTEADFCNDETFGLEEDLSSLNNDWEKHHEQLSKLIEIEHEKVKKSSPLRIGSKNVDIPSGFHSFSEPFHESETELSSDEEEKIVGNTISQLGLDDEADEADYMVKSSRPSQSFEFAESEESWTSPSRGKDRRPDSLHELISPGEGVWASPSRAMLRGGDHVVPGNDFKRKEEEDFIKKLFGGHDIVAAGKDGKTPSNQAIRVEDLERGLRSDEERTATIIERHAPQTPVTPMNPLMSMPMITPPPGLLFPAMPPRFQGNMASLLLMNRPFLQLGGIPGLPPLYPPLLSPQMLIRPPIFGSQDNYIRRGTPRGGSPWNSNRARGSPRYNSDKTWHRYPKQSHQEPAYQEQFVHMESSKMMNAKEKEWIFKISLMSLLSGDPNISDYYFISYMNKRLLKQATEKENADKEDVSENLEKTKQLMNYAQKQQQAKDSHRPVKFEGSLGKLSITSVHHPRQIMDFSTPEQEKPQSRIPVSGKKKFAMYGLIEKIYDMFLSLTDVERQLLDADAEQQDLILRERTGKIDKIFNMLKIKLHTTQETGDTDHFLHLMSITKSRKLIPRIFLYLKQEQSESILVSIIYVLPALLKKDNKEQALVPLAEKVKIILKKSNEDFKLKCVRILRKINLKMLLSYKLSIQLLYILLDSMEQKDPSHSLDWSFYESEVPKVIMDLPQEILSTYETELCRLKKVLNVKDLLINI